MLPSDTIEYAWNTLNQLTNWQQGQQSVTYTYDGDRMRVSSAPSGGATTNYLLDGDEIAEEITGTNDISYVGPGLICEIANGILLRQAYLRHRWLQRRYPRARGTQRRFDMWRRTRLSGPWVVISAIRAPTGGAGSQTQMTVTPWQAGV